LNTSQKGFQTHHCTPIFYGMPKVHKTPMKLQPVVSCINSFNSIFSKWLNFKMKTLLPLIPSYIKKNSFELIKELKSHHLPPSAKLVTADASSMYTYIDTTTGIQAMQDLFELFHEHIPTNFPRDFFLTTLEINMKNNIFSFGGHFLASVAKHRNGHPSSPSILHHNLRST
jgi:hypothetical protein